MIDNIIPLEEYKSNELPKNILKALNKRFAGFKSEIIDDFTGSKLSKLIKRGETYYCLRDYDTAIEYFEKAIEESKEQKQQPSSSLDLYFYNGLSYYFNHEYQDAIINFTESIELSSERGKLYFHRGIAYYCIGLYNESVSDITKSLDYFSNKKELKHKYRNSQYNLYEYLFYRGLSYYCLKDFNNAILDFTKSIEDNLNYDKSYLYRGKIFQQLNQTERAKSDFTNALCSNPEYSEAYLSRAILYSNDESYSKYALSDFNKAIDLNPSYAEAYFFRGLYYKNGIYDFPPNIWTTNGIQKENNGHTIRSSIDGILVDEWDYYSDQSEITIQDLTHPAKIEPDYPKEYSVTDTYNNADSEGKARMDFTKAISLKPDYTEAYYERAGLPNNYDPVYDYNKVIELKPFDVNAYCDLGNYYINNCRLPLIYNDEPDKGLKYFIIPYFTNAISVFTKAIDFNSNNPYLYYRRAYAHSLMYEFPQAILDYNKAIEIYSSNKTTDRDFLCAAYSERGEIYLKTNDFSNAILDFSKSLEIDSVGSYCYFLRGKAYYHNFEYANAISDFSRILESEDYLYYRGYSFDDYLERVFSCLNKVDKEKYFNKWNSSGIGTNKEVSKLFEKIINYLDI